MCLAEVAVYSPIPILIMFSFYQRVPREMIEAAKVDGAMEFALFTRVVLPLARPAVVLCLVFGFVWIWSDLFLPVGVIGFAVEVSQFRRESPLLLV